MRKRALGVAALTTLALTACGGSDPAAAPSAAPSESASAAPASGKLVIWADPNRVKALAPFADQFGTENGVTVEVKEISKDNQQTFQIATVR